MGRKAGLLLHQNKTYTAVQSICLRLWVLHLDCFDCIEEGQNLGALPVHCSTGAGTCQRIAVVASLTLA